MVLGGSTQARHLVDQLAGRYALTLSLAGATREPHMAYPPSVQLRSGGFGGIPGLVHYLRANRIAALIDATHPYAATMHHHAATACALVDVPHLRLDRPPWQPPPQVQWIDVADGSEAVARVRNEGWQRIFVTTGRVHLAPWRGLGDAITVIVRSIDPADLTGIDRVEAITGRGPFALADEMAILDTCDALVTRNSGGPDTKIQAAVATHTPILVWRRPPLPACDTVSEVADAIAWLAGHAGLPDAHL